MKTYPAEITPEVLERHANLSDAEVERDLAETEAEIPAYALLAEGLMAVADLPTATQAERTMNHFRASGHLDTNRDRRAFAAFLRRLLAARAAAVPA